MAIWHYRAVINRESCIDRTLTEKRKEDRVWKMRSGEKSKVFPFSRFESFLVLKAQRVSHRSVSGSGLLSDLLARLPETARVLPPIDGGTSRSIAAS